MLVLRLQVHPCPVELVWIPAHKLEHLPTEVISNELAAAYHTEPRHIHLNRVADFAAKKQADDACSVFPHMRSELLRAVLGHQEWLTKMHLSLAGEDLLRSQSYSPDASGQVDETPQGACTVEEAQKHFPLWPWQAALRLFKWVPKIPRDLDAPPKLKICDEDWLKFCNFLDGLRWQVDANAMISYVELAVIFHARGFSFSIAPGVDLTFHAIASLIRRACTAISSLPSTSAFPGNQNASRAKSSGRCLPCGVIEGAAPFVSDSELALLASVLLAGAGKRFPSWLIPVSGFSLSL